ncbi:MAG: flagellar motor switch protein FliN [Verrucomicrobiota bacterium]|jgi:flagellar motor switch protein FliN/FliY|nr:flagellar motor switch protein FliN [Verrucomicrobiota bacterium]
MSTETKTPGHDEHNLEFLMDVPLRLSAELGSCQMTMEELLELGVGSVIQLDQPANANVDVYVNQKLVARGEVVVAEENFGIRIKEVLSKAEI